MKRIAHSKTTISKSDRDSVISTINSGSTTKGSNNKLFEIKLRNFLQIENISLSSSGTMAFYKILLAMGITKNDEILMPDYMCNTLIGPIINLKAKAILYDNEKNSWLSNIDIILKKITKKTKIIVINHTFGFVFEDIDKLKKKISTKISIIEDCCHALTKNSQIGSHTISKHSLCSFYSFNSTKLIATGEGGAVATKNKNFFKEINKVKIGDNLSDLNCSLGLQQIKELPNFLRKRKTIASIYDQYFREFRGEAMRDKESIFYRYPILVKNNDIFLKCRNINYKLGVDSLCSDALKLKRQVNAKYLLNNTVSIPIYPSLKNYEIDLIVKKTRNLLGKCQ